MRRRAVPVLGALLIGLIAGCAEAPGGAGLSTTGRPGDRPSLEQAASRLPQSVADFTRGETNWHERERPGFGVAVDYAGPARSAVSTVSLYDRGQRLVPSDITSSTIQGEFLQAVRDAMAVAEGRTSQEFTEGVRSVLPIPGQAPLQCIELSGTYGRTQLQTLLCLGEAAGRFLKVQVTSPARQVRPVDPQPFVVGIAQAARG
ncbi:hypothetical protein HB662_18110 [Roseomonas frigidaquae]|uniref:Lipoprotein LpqN n=1 Tax=Falsiroseomonas frigidaquae TaxID=487318 RepID=A0ABX1F329_9PROT|nr:hypothetical protein [Falsiroseomonas frigidaquae]NKE46702.1 hypothetical protein [Falsiroseomonas frigidaquae]